MKQDCTSKIHFDSYYGIKVCHFTGCHDFPIHFHEYYILGVVDYGKWHMVYNRKNYLLDDECILLVNPLDCHSCSQISQEEYCYHSISIDKETMRKLCASIFPQQKTLPYFCEPVVRNDELKELLLDVYGAVVSREDKLYLDELLLSVFAELQQYLPPLAKVEESMGCADFTAVIRYMEEHYAEAIELEKLADICGYSKYHLLHAFSQQTGITPHSYLESIRIKKAMQLLKEKNKLADVAQLTGYYDESHFIKSFKKIVGLTPKQYTVNLI